VVLVVRCFFDVFSGVSSGSCFELFVRSVLSVHGYGVGHFFLRFWGKGNWEYAGEEEFCFFASNPIRIPINGGG